ncbi:uncharacterized protein [Heterodontus francisci]|uniref:uncharacterized protein n=1 Tax=Heterodontus francisci TaxID=7792 RepID=UPI00355BCDEA
MASVLPALLLCLFVQCVPTYTKQLCMLENAMMGGSFNLSITPKYYMPNTKYNVTIEGSASDVMVALSASYNSTSFGIWTNNAENCSGILQTSGGTTTEMWTSPENMTNMEVSVTFKAYVKISGNMTYAMNKTIKTAPMITPTPTPMKNVTMSGNMTTAGNMTQQTTKSTNMTTTAATVKPTSGAITFKRLDGFAIMLLLCITIRELLL